MRKIILFVCIIFSCNIVHAGINRSIAEHDFKTYFIGCTDAGSNYDVSLIVSINIKNNEVRLVSVLRDLDIRGKKINSYGSSEGARGVIKVLNEDYGLNIHKYIQFRWKDAIDLLNEFKPQSVTLSDKELYYINAYISNTCEMVGIKDASKYMVDTRKQVQSLNGLQILAYCRIRYGSSDYNRTKNQRTILSNIISELKSKSVIELVSLFTKYYDKLKTDLGLLDYRELISKKDKFSIVHSKSFPDRSMVTSKNFNLVPINEKECINDLHDKLFDNPFFLSTLNESEKHK